jgi:hypothetical protein
LMIRRYFQIGSLPKPKNIVTAVNKYETKYKLKILKGAVM